MLARKSRKILKIALPAGLVLLYLIWLGSGILRPPLSPPDDLEKDPLEAVGVFHIHSRHSDGRMDVPGITEIAAREDLEFVVLTDHGRPNLPSQKERGRRNGVLVIVGTEISSNRGHLVALGFPRATESLPREAGPAARQINEMKGLTVIAHPYSKTGWSWGGDVPVQGMEIINADTMLKRNFLRTLPWLPALPIRSRLPLLKLLSPPKRNLWKWDSLTRESKISGFYSADAHMLYRPLFNLLRLHVLLENPLSSDPAAADTQILAALRGGRFYNAVDGAAPANGFLFWAEFEGGRLPMGSERPFGPGITLKIRTPGIPFSRLRVIRDGKTFHESLLPSVEIPIAEAGVYRVEVYLEKGSPLDPRFPWILSNPIYLRGETHERDR